VDAALSIIRGKLSPDERAQRITGLRVLDIGCGSGALLLSLIHEYNHSKIDQTNVKNSPLLVSGCGIDIDDVALTYAEKNYREIFKGRSRGESSNCEEDVQWFNADFTKLQKEHKRLCGIASSWGDFDMVVCNPPYLSQKAGSGRVTAEGEVALIGGKSGLEAYESICKGILQCEEGQRAVSIRPLLSPTAWIVFQTPGGDRGKQRVAELVKSMGFELIEGSAFSNRRCLVIRRRRSTLTNSPRDRD
jgi:methylase of polypeptide subunit release factors